MASTSAPLEEPGIFESMQGASASMMADIEESPGSFREWASMTPEPHGPLDLDNWPFQREWYSEEVARAREVVWMKSTQVGMCLAPEMRVLTDDLRWIPLGDIEPGQAIVCVDEQSDGTTRGRKMRRGIVEEKWEVREPAFRLTLDNGEELIATAQHRFLAQHDTRRPALVRAGSACPDCDVEFETARAVSVHMARQHGYPRGHNAADAMGWRQVGEMAVGDRIRSIVQPWGKATYEDGWFGGLLDGEGSMRSRAGGSEFLVSQQLGPVYDRAKLWLEMHDVRFGEGRQEKPNGVVGRLCATRGDEVLRVVGLTRPTRFVKSCWWEGLCPPGMGRAAWPSIVEIEPLGEQRMIDIQTSEGTFIAEGFVSHNSANTWRWAARQADVFAETGIIVFPTETHIHEFSDERITPALMASEYLMRRMSGAHTKSVKQFGGGTLHLRGSRATGLSTAAGSGVKRAPGAQSVAAQFLVFDEYDDLDPTNLAQYERRITGAKQIGRMPRIRRLGVPTLPGYGIAAAYERSDKRRWIVQCQDCGARQEVTWEHMRWTMPGSDYVHRPDDDQFSDPEEIGHAWRACEECEAELDVREGEWVAQKPGHPVIGYHVSRMIVQNTDLEQIVKASRRTNPYEVEAFWQNDLGLPYVPAEAQLTDEDIDNACAQGLPPNEMPATWSGAYPVTAGLDVAGERDMNIRVSIQLPDGRRKAIYIAPVKGFGEVPEIMERYSIEMLVVDDNPERQLARGLQNRFPGRVVLCGYDDNDRAAIIKPVYGEKGTPFEGVILEVRVHRTNAIDSMMTAIREGRNLPPQKPPPGYKQHLKSLKRRTVEDTRGRPKRVYVKTGPNDDYAHAEVYDLIATELWRTRAAAQAAQAADGRMLGDEEIGFKRPRLDAFDLIEDEEQGRSRDAMGYDPGFNEGPRF